MCRKITQIIQNFIIPCPNSDYPVNGSESIARLDQAPEMVGKKQKIVKLLDRIPTLL